MLDDLKEATGKKTVKEALYQAVIHYIECHNIERIREIHKVNKKRGRFPVHLAKLMASIESK